MNLTQAFVRRAKCQDGMSKQEHYDNTIKGFMLEVRTNGRKTFFLKVTTPEGKRKSTKIGDATIIPADEARTKALKLKRAIEEGKEVTLVQTEQEQNAPTLIDFYNNHYLPYIQKNIKTWSTNDSVFRVHILPIFGNIPMNEIKKASISKAHMEMIHNKNLQPATANKLIIFLSNAYNVAIDLEIAGITSNPTNKIKLLEENNERQRFLTKREAKKLIKAVNQSLNPHLKYIVPMLILTGARRSEVLTVQWNQFDYTHMIWTIPVSKSGKKRTIPITQELATLSDTIPKRSRYLFPSPVTNKPHTSIYRSWNNARTKAGLQDVRLHDLRHAFASQLVNSGRSLYEVQMLLGHASMRMTQRYAHLNNESLMKAASCAGKLLG